MDLNETIRECLRAMTREIGCDVGFVNFRIGQILQSYLDGAQINVAHAKFHKLEETLCSTTIESDKLITVEDASRDDRFSDLLPVRDGHVVGYMAIPVKLDGETVGTICAVSRKPRHWRSIEMELLRSLGRNLETSLRAEVSERTIDRFATSLSEMDNILAILADGLDGPVAIFDADGSPVFYTESLPQILNPGCVNRLGHAAVQAYETSLHDARLRPGEKLDLRFAECDLAVVKASDKFYYCAMESRLTLLH